MGVEPKTLRLKVIDSTHAPLCPTFTLSAGVVCEAFTLSAGVPCEAFTLSAGVVCEAFTLRTGEVGLAFKLSSGVVGNLAYCFAPGLISSHQDFNWRSLHRWSCRYTHFT